MFIFTLVVINVSEKLSKQSQASIKIPSIVLLRYIGSLIQVTGLALITRHFFGMGISITLD